MKQLIHKINNTLYYFVKPENTHATSYSMVEQVNFNALLFAASLFSIITTIFSFMVLEDTFSNAFTIVFSVVFSYLYYLSRFKNHQHLWITLVSILTVLSICWFVYGGATGSTPYLYLLSLFIIIVIAKPKQQSLIIFIYLFNLATLYLLEYFYSDTLVHHYSSKEYYEDMVFTFLLVLLASFFVMRFFKHMYDGERQRVKQQQKIIETQNEEHLSSLLYASNLQRKIISNENELQFLFSDYFVLFKPKHIVTGDFYWVKQKEEFGIIVVADCTGHGVPAAFLSILGISILDELSEQIRELWTASKFLEKLRLKFVSHFNKAKEIERHSDDSIDLGALIIDYTELTLQFAGANRPLIIIRSNEQPVIANYSEIKKNESHTLYLFKGTKNTIGYNYADQAFVNNTIQFYPNDTFYLLSDGYCDQFDSNNKKKFKMEQLKNELLKIQGLPMATQGEHLNSIYKRWKGDNEQTDDILIVGMRI